MPLYLLDAARIDDGGWNAAVRLAAQRYPELTLERRFADHHEPGREVWLCRAPSEDQVLRWAAAAALRLADVRHIDAIQLGPTGRPRRQEKP